MLEFVNNTPETPPDKIISACAAAFGATLAEESQSGDATLVFVSNAEIQTLNKTYRGMDAITDVLSFVSEESEKPYLGDIIICVERAQAQADAIGHPLAREMAFLTVHSALHLMGYDHMDDASENVMTEKQKVIMSQIDPGIIDK